jgi:molecular chaperone GrpE
MTKEQKDGFSIHDKRFWVEDEERDGDERAPTAPAPPAIDPEVLRSALADLEEAKRRVRRDADKQIELMRAQVLESLLPVLDNLERSMAAGAEGGSVGALLGGVRLVHSQFLAALAPFGLSRKSAVGERFDPRLHDAVAVVPVADAREDGVVVAELEPAYVVGERVVRPAKVQVGRAADRPTS